MCISDKGKLNKSELDRYVSLIRLVKSEERGNLGHEVKRLIDEIYEYMHQFEFGEDKDIITVSKSDHEAMIDQLTVNYLNSLDLNLRTDKMLTKYRDEVNSLFKVLTIKTTKKSGVRFNYRILPTPDNRKYDQIGKFNSIFFSMFEINDTKIPDDMKYGIKKRHLSEEMFNAYYAMHEYFTGKQDGNYEP